MNSSDSWRTPQDLFDILNKGGVYQGIEFKGYNFDIDLCATRENSKCDWYGEDYLRGSYKHRKRVDFNKENIKDFKSAFMNPPYSNPKPFIKKAWENSKYCKIVCLIKCDPSTQWWATFWNYAKGPKLGCEVLFFSKRIKFDPPIELVNSGEVEKINGHWHKVSQHMWDGVAHIGYIKLSGPAFGCALIIMDRRGLE